MKKFTLYIGLNDKETKVQTIPTESAITLAENLLCEICGGATISQARGVYTHDDGTKVIENTLVCVVFGCDIETITRAAVKARDIFNQESVALESCEVNSVFI